MGYITTERVKQIRTELKNLFPETKFSVTKEDHSGVRISIMKSTLQFENAYQQVNHYYIDEHYTGEQATMLNAIKDIAMQGVKYYETGDYGMQPSHYVCITVGKWDKPYEYQN